MSIGQIQLGVKKSSGESLDRYSAQGFFYGGGVEAPGVGTQRSGSTCTSNGSSSRLRAWESRVGNPARQHLIFYDNPSSKRVARCTNIPQKGALPTVKGVGQRLRKGFQGSGVYETQQKQLYLLITRWVISVCCQCRGTCLESLSSAAEIRHSARNTRL